MANYGRIKVENISLSDKMFCMICDKLKCITDHHYQDHRAFYIYGIDKTKLQYNVDRGSITQQTLCYLDMINFHISRCLPPEKRNGLLIKYISNEKGA